LIKGEQIMADLSAVYQTYNNAGTGIAASYLPANNYKNVISTSDAGRELIVKIASTTTINDAELLAAISEITRSQGSNGSGDSAFTIAGVGTADGTAFVSGTTADVFLRCQGTGDLTVADIKSAAEGATGGGAGTFTVSVIAHFTPAK
jgi:hypothetical protein